MAPMALAITYMVGALVTILASEIYEWCTKFNDPPPDKPEDEDAVHKVEPRFQEYSFMVTKFSEAIRTGLKLDSIGFIVGYGTHSHVHVAVEKDGGTECALKLQSARYTALKERPGWYTRAMNEVEMLKATQSHPNVVQYRGFLMLNKPTDDKPAPSSHLIIKTEYMIMTLEEMLCHHIEQFSYQASVLFAKNLSAAVEFIHSKGIAHRDIHCANVMVNYDKKAINKTGQLMKLPFKVIDFGRAKRYDSLSTIALLECEFNGGRLGFKAPEKSRNPLQPYNPFRSDYFSVGVTVSEVIYGLDQYRAIKAKHVRYDNVDISPAMERWKSQAADEDMAFFLSSVKKLMSRSCYARPTMSEFASRIARL